MKVPPWNSCGFNFCTLALSANSLTSLEISANPFKFALVTIGVIKPKSVCTAMLISTFLYFLIKFPCHEELVSGTFMQASEAALIIRSLIDNLTGEYLFNSALRVNSLSTLHSTPR